MKSLVPWMCMIAASASTQVFADESYMAYRLGDYNKATGALVAQSGKDAVADYYLGRLYLYGYGQLKNNNLAMQYFKKSADKGYLPAVLVMAKYYLLHDHNPEAAIPYFKQAATVGDIPSQMFMAAAYLFGVGVKPNEDLARKFYIEAAKNGNALAQYTLAEHFIDSRQTSNQKLGLIWLNKAVAGGNVQAMAQLGSLYIDGKLVPKDLAKAQELLQQAAAKNSVQAIIGLGDLAMAQEHYDEAITWYKKALDLGDMSANLHLAHVYFKEKTPMFNATTGFEYTLKAAQAGVPSAQAEVAQLYAKGVGVAADEASAKKWLAQSKRDVKSKSKLSAQAQAALWLSQGATEHLAQTEYQMKGIFSAWQNTLTMKDHAYNQSPQVELITRKEIFNPQYVMTKPNDVPINSYYDALVSKQVEFDPAQWTYPRYHLNQQLQLIQDIYGAVVQHEFVPTPLVNANYFNPDDFSNATLMDQWLVGWQEQANYMAVFNELYFRAILGDANAQFEVGQMFQYGLGVTQSYPQAIMFYENAAAQQMLKAEYNLGILYLTKPMDDKSYQTGMNWLTDAAFKGSKMAQYTLANVLMHGVTGADGKEYIKPNPEQAQSLLYLSSANGYGPAEFELAEYLARDNQHDLSVEVKRHKIATIRQLYAGAAAKGVSEALLPLAYYNAMDTDKARQAQAFAVAREEAQTGDPKASLLLGMLYDRGIGVAVNPDLAMSWYQKAGSNAVSQFILGTYKTEGKGIELNKEEGLALLKQSAQAQFSYANFNLAVVKHQLGESFLPDLITAYGLGNSHAGIVLADSYLASGDNVEQMTQARDIYSGLAQKGDQIAELKLAFMMSHGLGSAPDPMGALEWYTASAQQGNAQAQYLLGQLYQVGALGQPDEAQAKKWFEQAAKTLPMASVALGFIYETVDDDNASALKAYEQAAQKGDVLGLYNLALMYQYGKGVPVDYAKAKTLFTQSADKGLDLAMYELGSMNFNGFGQERDEQQALVWYEKAAALGDSNALYVLGLLSETGVATRLDFAQALKYYRQSADLGNDKAMLALARMYHYGLGIPKDPKMAASIYQQLADRQNAYAQYKLGSYYLDGTVGERSPEKARVLLQKASDNGNIQARKMLQRLQAQTQSSVSFVEPVFMNTTSIAAREDAGRMYMNALNEWNRGDEVLSRMILNRLVSQYPHYVPAKKAYEQLNQARTKKTIG